MKNYFFLQFTIINRQLKAFGINPVIGQLLIIILFFVLSFLLFNKTEYAEYIYLLFALSFLSKINYSKRISFLKTIFSKHSFYKVRLVENLLISFPFTVVLLYYELYLTSSALLSLSVLLVFFESNNTISLVIPTPFYKTPFEFIIGFRNTFFLFPFSYFILYKAIENNNYNLALASLVFTLLISLNYYSKAEKEYFVWIDNKSSMLFIINKLKVSIIHSSILSIPLLVIILFAYNDYWQTTLFVQFVFYFYLATVVLAKYSAYPNNMSVPQGLILIVAILMPPVLLIIIPYLYIQSVKNLQDLLR